MNNDGCLCESHPDCLAYESVLNINMALLKILTLNKTYKYQLIESMLSVKNVNGEFLELPGALVRQYWLIISRTL